MHAENQTEWMRQQLTLPQTSFSTGELALLSGLDLRRVRRYLQRKRIIRPTGGEKHEIQLDTLIREVPDFWRSIRLRIAKLVGEEEGG